MLIPKQTQTFLEHLAEFNNMTDEELEKRSTNEFGRDAVEFLNLSLERELCKSTVGSILKQLTNKF